MFHAIWVWQFKKRKEEKKVQFFLPLEYHQAKDWSIHSPSIFLGSFCFILFASVAYVSVFLFTKLLVNFIFVCLMKLFILGLFLFFYKWGYCLFRWELLFSVNISKDNYVLLYNVLRLWLPFLVSSSWDVPYCIVWKFTNLPNTVCSID